MITRRDILKTAGCIAPLLLLPKRGFSQTIGGVSLYHTNDTHSRIDPFQRGTHAGKAGVSRRATLLSRLRAQNNYSLLLDAGDVFQGTPWFNKYHGVVEMQMMAALGYDAMTLGNHDFDGGMKGLCAAISNAPQLEILCSNYHVEGTCLESRVRKYNIFKKGPVKIGVFGLGIQLEGLVSQKLCAGVTYEDPRHTANEMVALLKEQGCHLIVALSHLGYDGYENEVGDVDWPKDVAGVNYVVGGHTHTLLSKPDMIKHKDGRWETAVMQVGHSGLWLGAANFEVSSRSASLKGAGRTQC